jgi:hypothetical protein
MGVLSVAWGTVLTTRAKRGLQVAAGVASVAVGADLVARTAFGVALVPL